MAAYAITYPDANPDSLHSGLIASFATWKDNTPQSSMLWMLSPSASTSHPKKTPLMFSYCEKSCTWLHVAIAAQTQRSRREGSRWVMLKMRPQNSHMWCMEQQLLWGSSICKRLYCKEMVLPATRWEQRPDQTTSAGGASPPFGQEDLYYNTIWTDSQKWLEKEGGIL